MEKRSPNLSSPLFKMDPSCLWKKLKKIIILILSAVKKYHYSTHGGTLEIQIQMRVIKAKILKWKNCLWRENYIASGVSGCLWWGRGWDRGVGIKTLYGGNTDFMNHHTKYKKTLKTGWCDILTHPVKYRRISCQLKHTCSVLSSRPKRSRFAVNY